MLFALAALAAALPVFAAAQASAADAVTADTPVPPPVYRSAFQGLPVGVEEGKPEWKDANAQVARFPRGHADWLQWEAQHGSASVAAPPAPAASARNAAPAGGSAPAPAGRAPQQRH
jgi:hypothetical protein